MLMINESQWQQMKNVDIRTVNKEDLVDLNSIDIDDSIPVSDRIENFVRQIKNPYCFKVGDIAVKVVYKENGPTFQQNFEEMLLSL